MSDGGEGLWFTISDLAKLRRVDKSAISRRVSRLETQGLITTRRGEGGTKLVLLAEFDRVVGETTDAVRAMNGAAIPEAAPAPAGASGDLNLSKEQARRASYAADISKLELQKMRRELVPVSDVHRFHDRMVGEVRRVTSELPTRAEEMAAIVAKDGFAGGREFLRRLGRDLDEAFANAIGALGESLAHAEEDAA